MYEPKENRVTQDISDDLAFRRRLRAASEAVTAAESAVASTRKQLAESVGRLREARQQLDELIRADAVPLPLFDREPAPEPTPDPPPMTHGQATAFELHRALHRVEGAAERWRERREKGATDEELRGFVGYEFGVGGASGNVHTGSPGYQVDGGKRPKFWLGYAGRSRQPDLAGAELLARVREVLGIGQPKGDV